MDSQGINRLASPQVVSQLPNEEAQIVSHRLSDKPLQAKTAFNSMSTLRALDQEVNTIKSVSADWQFITLFN
jgi:hypothetical protein